MKFLIDENLSEVLVGELVDIAPGSVHVRTAGLGGSSDERLWDAARDGGFTILTRDEDFVRLSIARGYPPKVVHVQLGNCTTRDVIDLVDRKSSQIQEFITSSAAGFLVAC